MKKAILTWCLQFVVHRDSFILIFVSSKLDHHVQNNGILITVPKPKTPYIMERREYVLMLIGPISGSLFVFGGSPDELAKPI